MKILFITPHPDEGASTRYRARQFFSYFNSMGIECLFSPFLSSQDYNILYKRGRLAQKAFTLPKGVARRLGDVIRSRSVDIVFIHLEAWPVGLAIFERFFGLCKKPIIYDLDDAIYMKASSSVNRVASFLKNPGKIPTIIEMSDHVITCNDHLRRYASEFNKNVTMIPTSVDTNKFTVRNYSLHGGRKPVIGWIGSHSTALYLKQLREVFKQLAEKHDFVLKIVGAAERDHFPGIDTIYSDWSLKKDIAEFQDLDIGIYPLPDNEWVKGKTGFKTVQYMAAGVPCVVSRVGRNIEIVKNRVNGFLASSQQEWIDRLSCLIENPKLREEIGLAGRKTVEEKFSIKVNGPKYIEVFNKVYDG